MESHPPTCPMRTVTPRLPTPPAHHSARPRRVLAYARPVLTSMLCRHYQGRGSHMVTFHGMIEWEFKKEAGRC